MSQNRRRLELCLRPRCIGRLTALPYRPWLNSVGYPGKGVLGRDWKGQGGMWTQASELKILERQTETQTTETILIDLLSIQESCAIAKMTAQCALHMGALKIFGTP